MFLLLLLVATGILVWPLLFSGLIDEPRRLLGTVFFVGLAAETLLIRSKLRAAVAMEIYGGIFLDRHGHANTPGVTVLLIALAHAAVTIVASLLALSAIGNIWASPTLAAILVLTIVVCRAAYIGFVLAAPSEGTGSGPAGAMGLELLGAFYVAIVVLLIWSGTMSDPNGWAIKAEGRPDWVEAGIYCGLAALAAFLLRLPIALIERRSARSLPARILRWTFLLVAALGAISPVALLAL